MILKSKNVSDEIMTTHEDGCTCLICSKLKFKMTTHFVSVVRKAKMEIKIKD